jgi:hypothetical protein
MNRCIRKFLTIALAFASVYSIAQQPGSAPVKPTSKDRKSVV